MVVHSDMDPLSLVRKAATGNATVVLKGGKYSFGQHEYDEKVETCFMRTLPGSAKKYYTLKDVVFYMNNSSLQLSEYRKKCIAERCTAIVETDKPNMLNYLTGKIDMADQIDTKKADEVVLAKQKHDAKKQDKDKASSSSSSKRPHDSASIDKDERGAKAGTSTTKKSKSHDTKSTPSASTYNTPEARLEALLALQKGGLAGYDAQIDTDPRLNAIDNALKDNVKLAKSAATVAENRAGDASVADRCSVLRTSDPTIGNFAVKMYHDVIMRKEHEATRASQPGAKGRIGRTSTSTKDRDTADKAKAKAIAQNVIKPIIIVPSAVTSILNSVNVYDMLSEGVYKTVEQKREEGCVRQTQQTVHRKLQGSKGDIALEYKVVDNPIKLSEKDWDSVVAVFCSGQAWQFKGWKWSNPAELFSNVLGMHLTFSDRAVDANVSKWNCTVLKLSPHQRHHDKVEVNKFWKMLDAHIKMNKPDIHTIVEKHTVKAAGTY